MFKILGKTDKGIVREQNQDAYQIFELDKNTYLAIVCDGMGGEKGGEVASAIAVSRVVEVVDQNYRPSMNENSVRDMLQTAVISANIIIFDRSAAEDELCGMGTTIVAALVRGDEVHMINVGDSRAYSFFEGSVLQITTDHTIVQTYVEQGKITIAEARCHPKKHLITRALGVEESVSVDHHDFCLRSGEKILICTDGLSNYLEDTELAEELSHSDDAYALEMLVEKAKQKGGADNITAVIISFK